MPFASCVRWVNLIAMVEPIRLRRHLLMNRSQTSVAISENSDRSGISDSRLPEGNAGRRSRRLGTPVEHKGRTSGISFPLEHFAGNEFKVALGSLVPGSDVTAIQADHHFFAGFAG
jgi:hypothetical protein